MLLLNLPMVLLIICSHAAGDAGDVVASTAEAADQAVPLSMIFVSPNSTAASQPQSLMSCSPMLVRADLFQKRLVALMASTHFTTQTAVQSLLTSYNIFPTSLTCTEYSYQVCLAYVIFCSFPRRHKRVALKLLLCQVSVTALLATRAMAAQALGRLDIDLSTLVLMSALSCGSTIFLQVSRPFPLPQPFFRD